MEDKEPYAGRLNPLPLRCSHTKRLYALALSVS